MDPKILDAPKKLVPPSFSGIRFSVLCLAAFCGVVLLNLFLDLNEALSSCGPVRSHHVRLEFGLFVLAYWPQLAHPHLSFRVLDF